MFTIPIKTWFGIPTLPDYVFNYIYEVGTLQDLPWVRWIDDDLGSRIMRIRITENPNKVGAMCKKSPLFHHLEFQDTITQAYYELIGVDSFEARLLHFAQQNSFKIKSMF